MHPGSETKPEIITESSPTYAILKKLRLEVGENSNILRKAIFFSVLTWIPLLILTVIEGTALNNNIKIPFLLDYVTYGKFLVSLPMLFVAEKFIRFEISNSISHFVTSGIITSANEQKYSDLVLKYSRLQNSKVIEIVLLIWAYAQLLLLMTIFEGYGDVSSWKVFSDGTKTLALYYYVYISAPLLQFFILRMMLRFLLWAWFLWKVSRMELNLIPIDPDFAGGLGFLGTAQLSFGILGFAQAVSYSAEIANKIIYGGIPFDDFKFPVLIAIGGAVLIYISPLFFFTKKLMKLKLKGLLEYGVLAHKYTTMFDNKWIKGKDYDELLGTGDIQSLNDLRGSYEIVQSSRFVPFNPRNFVGMVLMITVPFFPLVTLKIPLVDILKGLAGIVL